MNLLDVFLISTVVIVAVILIIVLNLASGIWIDDFLKKDKFFEGLAALIVWVCDLAGIITIGYWLSGL